MILCPQLLMFPHMHGHRSLTLFGHYKGGGSTIEGEGDQKFHSGVLSRQKRTSRCDFRPTFVRPKICQFSKSKTHHFSNLRSEIKAQCRPAEPGLAVRIIGLAVENLCVESCPGEMEEGLNIRHQSFKYGPISA